MAMVRIRFVTTTVALLLLLLLLLLVNQTYTFSPIHYYLNNKGTNNPSHISSHTYSDGYSHSHSCGSSHSYSYSKTVAMANKDCVTDFTRSSNSNSYGSLNSKYDTIKQLLTEGNSCNSNCNDNNPSDYNIKRVSKQKNWTRIIGGLALAPMLLLGSFSATADDELAKYAAEGNKVAVDGQCFIKKCALETSKCANDPSCLKGLSCLARCKGGSLCSTGCFAKFGSDKLDNVLSCSVEKNDCVQVPGKSHNGWTVDKFSDLPGRPLANFDMNSLDGKWYKIMGLDSRYDCFDCQKNTFEVKNKNTLKMEALFRIPRPTSPGYMQNKIVEELHATDKTSGGISHMQSSGQMFGLTFWENWYILGENKPLSTMGVPLAFASSADSTPEMKLVYYTGHTLQGSYKGAFLYSRSNEITPGLLKTAANVISKSGLNPNDFCIIKNQCFLSESNVANEKRKYAQLQRMSLADSDTELDVDEETNNFWFVGQKFFKASTVIASELADWFQDPAIVSEWLVSQQQRMVLQQPLAVSPFASLDN